MNVSDEGEPLVLVFPGSGDNGEEAFLNTGRDRTTRPVTDLDLVDASDWSDLRCRARKKEFISQVKQFAGDPCLTQFNSEILADFHDGLTCNSGKY